MSGYVSCPGWSSSSTPPTRLLRDTPFRVVYGRDPPSIRSYEPGDMRVAAVTKSMEEREEFLVNVRYRLEQAQATQKLHYDKVHRHVAY
jgi:hypothetical protein